MEYDAWESNSGFHVVPAFCVFQTPPEPTATYQVLALRGSTAMSAMRPDISAGPMLRSFRPSSVFAESRGAGVAAGAGDFEGSAPAGAAGSASSREASTDRAVDMSGPPDRVEL